MLNSKEQTSLNQYVEITGIPKTTYENLPNTITSVDNLFISMKNKNIADTYRMKSYKNTDGKIIAKFNSITLKGYIHYSIQLWCKNKNSLTDNKLHTNFL